LVKADAQQQLTWSAEVHKELLNKISHQKIPDSFYIRRNPSRYEYIQTGLELLGEWLWQSSVETIAMPALGCGNGGLDWNKVQGMIARELHYVKQEIIVYLPT